MDSNMQFYNLKLPNPSSISSFKLLKTNKQTNKKKNTLFLLYIFISTGVLNTFILEIKDLDLRCTCAFLHILYLVFPIQF